MSALSKDHGPQQGKTPKWAGIRQTERRVYSKHQDEKNVSLGAWEECERKREKKPKMLTVHYKGCNIFSVEATGYQQIFK